MSLILTIYAVLSSLLWCVVYLKIIRSYYNIPFFDSLVEKERKRWPKLSVVIAACNEGDHIEAALCTLLTQDYPDLEVIVVNDRSEDNTGKILNALSARYWSLRVVHLDQLPDGWLGKIHALHIGTKKAKGEWILYSDADVHFEQGVLKKGVGFALDNGLDHLAVVPGVKARSFLLKIAINAFGGMFVLFTGAGSKKKSRADKAVGIGAFNLVKRSVLERTEGFEWLRMEVADDVGLALLLKRHGARSGFAIAKNDLSVRWYESVGGMFRGLEKNIFGSTTGYSYAKMIVVILLSWGNAFGPFVAIAFVRTYHLWLAGAAACLFLAAAAFVGKKRFGGAILPYLFAPLGQIIISLMLLRAGILCGLRGGIVWRGTLYPALQLRRGQRVRL